MFLTRNKRPPLDIITYLFATLQKDNRIVKCVRVDEDKSLANCTEFCQLLHKHHVRLQGTGGYASDKNGKAESLNKSLKYATIAALTNANMPVDFWCFAMQHCNTIIRNMSLNPTKTKTSYEAWTNKRPNWNEFRIPFCNVYIVTNLDDITSNKRYTFLAFGPSTSIVYYWDSQTKRVKMGHHAYFDDHSSGRPQPESTPGSRLLHDESSTLQDLKLNEVDINTLEQYILHPPGPFRIQDLFIHIADFSNEKPPHYGLDISFDSSYGLPIIKSVSPTSSFYQHLPASFRRNIWITAVEDDEPISPKAVYDAVNRHVTSNHPVLSIIICKRTPSMRSELVSLRAQFDQLQTIHKESSYAVSLSTRPDTPKSITDINKSNLKIEWKKSLFENYTKNAKACCFTAPFPREHAPANIPILKSIMAFQVKDISSGVYDLYSRHCVSGTKQIKGCQRHKTNKGSTF